MTTVTDPRKLTPKTHKAIIEAIDAGLRFKVDIAGYAGIRSKTLLDWCKLAETDDPGSELARKLVDDMDQALARRKARYLLKIQTVGGDDWRMWREMMAITDPKGYGPRSEIELTGNVQTNITLTWGDNDADANHTSGTP